MMTDFDVIVAGAGPGGSVAARDLARSGLRVGLFDASAREGLGKTIIIEAEKEMFRTVGVAVPAGDEVPYHASGHRIFSPSGKQVFHFGPDHPSIGLYVDRFAKKLLAEAEAAGAVFFGGHRAADPIVAGGKVQGVKFSAAGREQEIKARLVIDATGFDAALVRKLDPALGIEFPESPGDVVVAENCFHELLPDRAEAAIAAGRASEGEVWNRLGRYGNYSTVYSHLARDPRRAYLLIGRKADYPAAPISDLIDQEREELGFFGKQLHGGRGLIRVRHSLDRLVADGFMVIGEAACMVIPMHGSGVSSALYSGHLAARAASAALASGEADTGALWPYAAEYQRGRGGVLAAFDVNRLVLETITGEQLAALVESGIMAGEDFLNSFYPRLHVSPGTLPRRLVGVIKTGLFGPALKIARLTTAAQRHYARYPLRLDPSSFAAWKRGAADIFAKIQLSE
jgi:flavin-dependent dehydrogenase